VQRLEHDNAELRGELAAARADDTTRAELDRLQLAASDSGRRILPARVIAFGPGAGFEWTVTLDVGTGSGVAKGQTVTDGAGLVGRVVEADASTAVVLLAADPGSGVGVRDLRTGQVGIATGRAAVRPTAATTSLDLVGVILDGGQVDPQRVALQPAPTPAGTR
jgi:rod shape-determining protein MreC